MELKIVKSRPPDIRLKKNAEVKIHKKEFISPAKKKETFAANKSDSSFQIRRRKDTSRIHQEIKHQERTANLAKSKKPEKRRAVSTGRKTLGENLPQDNMVSAETFPQSKTEDWNGREGEKAFGPAEEKQKTDFKERIQRRKKVRAEKQSRISKTSSHISKAVGEGLRLGGQAMLQQTENETDHKESFYVLDKAIHLYENRQIEKNAEKIRKPEKEMKIRKKSGIQREVKKKQRKQAIRERKLAYIMDKLSGQNQDSAAKTIKDIAIYKASAALSAVGKKLVILAAPVFGSLLLVMLPIILLFLLFYASPLAAFMPAVDGGPSVQEVLSGYYQEFHNTVKEAGGESITYLHEKDGAAESNFMDTLMVYMVQYGTGDLGIVMDDTHKRYLKEVFDEMNSFENKTVTTTIQAGQSLGQVVTSAYCSLVLEYK